jgi:catechol 2,3-dioxygenase-like lactoylglutathione lyase family enzyme
MTTTEAPARFHLSLNVTDLGHAVAFYRLLFGVGPAKQHDDYAKFDLAEPPVVFALVPQKPGPGGALSHLGLRVADAAAIDAVRQRLEAAGIPTQTQECTVCGYARQSKCWAADPDGNHWEIYVLEEDVDPASVRQSLEGPAARLEAPPGPAVWEHSLTHPWPARIPHADASLDEVRLTGTFNAAAGAAECRALVAEAWCVLRPGGKVLTHGLLADRQFADESSQTRHVLYKGPFKRATDEDGSVYRRGERVAVTAAAWERLRAGPAAEQFLFFPPGG